MKNKAAQELGRLGGLAGRGKTKKQPPRPRCACGCLLRRDGGCTKCENKRSK